MGDIILFLMIREYNVVIWLKIDILKFLYISVKAKYCNEKNYYITLQLNPDERCLCSRDASFQMQFGLRCGWVYYHYNEMKTKAIKECYVCEILFINTLKIQVNTQGMQINLWTIFCFTLNQYFIQLEYRFTFIYW